MEKTIKKLVALVMSGIFSMVFMMGCGNASGKENTSEAGKVTTVIIGTQEMPNDEGIAKAMDYFSEEMGVEVEIK